MTFGQYCLSHFFLNRKGEVVEITKWIGAPAVKAEDLSSTSKTYIVEEKINSEELYFDFHICAVGSGPSYTYIHS